MEPKRYKTITWGENVRPIYVSIHTKKDDIIAFWWNLNALIWEMGLKTP